MVLRELGIVLVVGLLLSGCTTTRIVYKCPPEKRAKKAVVYKAPKPKALSKEAKAYNNRVARLQKRAARYWGKKAKVASRYEYVKYMQNYRTRASINFETGVVSVEASRGKHAKTLLKKAIMTTLLSPQNPESVDLFSARDRIQKGIPFLYTKVLDQEGKAIRWRWRAGKFADYLIARKLQKSRTHLAVSFPMKRDFVKVGGTGSYRSIVNAQARRFGLEPALIMAFIETESHFNPFATSAIPAYGLMQVVPTSAGRDAWAYLKNQKGKPSRSYLFNARNNIEMGTAYVKILMSRYLSRIKNPKTREYCAIASYNTGSGNVLRTFSRNRTHAFNVINRMSPEAVFYKLKTKLPYDETRRYLVKVTQAKKRYN